MFFFIYLPLSLKNDVQITVFRINSAIFIKGNFRACELWISIARFAAGSQSKIWCNQITPLLNLIFKQNIKISLFLETSRNFLEPWILPGSDHFLVYWASIYLNFEFCLKNGKCHVFNVFRYHLFQNPKITRDIKKYKIFPFLRQNSWYMTKIKLN